MEHVSGHTKQEQVTGDSQHRFTKSKLCLINLITCHDKTVGVVDERRTVDVTDLDFRKAFDDLSLYPFICTETLQSKWVNN